MNFFDDKSRRMEIYGELHESLVHRLSLIERLIQEEENEPELNDTGDLVPWIDTLTCDDRDS